MTPCLGEICGRFNEPFQYFEPSTLAEALEILHHYQDRARVLAGGTDLVVQMKQAKSIPEAVVSLRRLQELDFIEVDSGIRMGPRVTMTQIANHPAFAGRFSILKEAALAVADVQIRNLATVGGNIANASPSADVPPALVALGAQLRLRSKSREVRQEAGQGLSGVPALLPRCRVSSRASVNGATGIIAPMAIARRAVPGGRARDSAGA